MSLNTTPSSDRIHIGIFGRRNAGKSSVINALTGQSLSIVSDIKGTTTDPVFKAMELLPLGPVVMIDTPGLDDEGDLGALRIKKAYQILNKTDIALLVLDSSVGMSGADLDILDRIEKKQIPYVVVWNKCDLSSHQTETDNKKIPAKRTICISTVTGENISALKELIAKQVPAEDTTRKIVADLLPASSFVVLVVPIDKSAPKGRLILPQQQTIRDLLEHGCTSIVVRDSELEKTLMQLGRKPDLVITDSQVFSPVSKLVSPEIPLTSFSILFARYKGNLRTLTEGALTLDTVQDGDRILISEGCTHHRQCEDIGTIKLPLMLQKHTGKKLHFEFTSGTEFPDDLQSYRLIIHCGGCTLNEREMKYRLKCAEDQDIPMTNYGIAMAHMQSILKRSIEIFTTPS